MFDVLQKLCELDGVSGREQGVREAIYQEIAPYASCRVDALGNLIAEKKGKQPSAKKVMLCAHMDEVGLIITQAEEEGYLRFSPVGGIDPRVLLGRGVRIGEQRLPGVIGSRPVHLIPGEERQNSPQMKEMYLDIGARSREEALEAVSLGEFAALDGDYCLFGDGFIKSKALDDRIGCALLVDLLREELDYDITCSFHVQEEIGLRGAKTAAYSVAPDLALVLESTTAADTAGVEKGREVCRLGQGPVLSFMDGRTIYDRELYQLALDVAQREQIPCQVKTAVAGGNDGGAIHTSRSGVRTLAISLPCRYIHSGASVVKQEDILQTARLIRALLKELPHD